MKSAQWQKVQKLQSLRDGPDVTGVQAEIVGEMASALGEQGRKATAIMAEFYELTEGHENYVLVRDQARYEIWAYFIQRELCGMRNHKQLIADLKIPPQIYNFLGPPPTNETSADQ